jgi:hypothetical protein
MYDDLPARFADDDGQPTVLRRFFFREASLTETPADVIAWWEKRRLAYNVAVGATGLGTLVAVNAIGLVGPEPHPFFPPAIAFLVYGGLANVMYTGGWVAELLLRPVFGRKTPVVGATLFRYGFAFSIGVTLLPIVAAGIDLTLRILKAIGAS